MKINNLLKPAAVVPFRAYRTTLLIMGAQVQVLKGERKTGKGYRQLEPVSILVISKHFQNKYLSKGAAMHFFHLPACRIFAV